MQLIIVALAPSLLWLWWFSLRGGQQVATIVIARAFALGALASIPSCLLENWGTELMPHWSMIGCFVAIGPAEELLKFAACRLALNRARLSSPASGVVYAAAAALGFAFAENIGCFAELDPATIIMRLLTSVPAHVLFSVPWGIALGRARFSGQTKPVTLVMALTLSSFLHGAFDALAFNIGSSPVLLLVLFGLLIQVLWRTYWKVMNDRQHQVVRDIHWSELARPLKWDWVGFTFMLGVVISIGVALLFDLDLPWKKFAHPSEVLGAGLIIGLFFTGLLAPFWAPDDSASMRESAAGLSILGAVAGTFMGKEPTNITNWSFGLALLGALGGWLGEALRAPPESDSAAAEMPPGSNVPPSI